LAIKDGRGNNTLLHTIAAQNIDPNLHFTHALALLNQGDENELKEALQLQDTKGGTVKAFISQNTTASKLVMRFFNEALCPRAIAAAQVSSVGVKRSSTYSGADTTEITNKFVKSEMSNA
jgi:hypothetical protein